MQKEGRIEEGFIIITSDDAAERASYDWADMGRAVCKFGEDLKCCRKTRDRPEQRRRGQKYYVNSTGWESDCATLSSNR